MSSSRRAAALKAWATRRAGGGGAKASGPLPFGLKWSNAKTPIKPPKARHSRTVFGLTDQSSSSRGRAFKRLIAHVAANKRDGNWGNS